MKDAVPVTVRLYDQLIDEEKANSDVDILDKINVNSLVIRHGFAESAIKNAKVGERYQFLRTGYFIKDEDSQTEKAPVFNKIVGLKDKFRFKA